LRNSEARFGFLRRAECIRDENRSMAIKAISLKQPWATLVILGAKMYETRSWNTSHRGVMAIHASRTFSDETARLCLHEPFRSVLRGAGYRSGWDLPRGVVLGTVELVEVCATAELDPRTLSATELAFGNFRPRRFAFQLAHPRKWDPPVPMPGHLNIYDIDLTNHGNSEDTERSNAEQNRY